MEPAVTAPARKNIFQYAGAFTLGLIKDNKFWSRFNAMPNGAAFVAQGVAGIACLLASAPLAAQIFGIIGCGALMTIGLYGIAYGFPKAWKSMEELCVRTFPKLNPLKKVREPVERIAHRISEKPLPQKIIKSQLIQKNQPSRPSSRKFFWPA